MRRIPAALLLVLLVLAFALRIDLWWWSDPRLVLGMPIGLTYHVLFCLAVSLGMAWVVRFAWPVDERDEDDKAAS